jgi:hypothetical protein
MAAPIWTIGPVIRGHNYSVGMPPTMVNKTFAFPPCSNPVSPRGPSVHYVTRACRSLSEQKLIRLVFEVVGDGFVCDAEHPTGQGRLSLYFQRRGDNWSARGVYGAYRWYSAAVASMTPGEHVLEVPLRFVDWRAVSGAAASQPRFREAKANAVRVGFTLGGSNKGHGNCVLRGAAQFVMKEFRVL